MHIVTYRVTSIHCNKNCACENREYGHKVTNYILSVLQKNLYSVTSTVNPIKLLISVANFMATDDQKKMLWFMKIWKSNQICDPGDL